MTHEQIDLTKLPVPLLHHGDGGKFIQTYGMWCYKPQINHGLIGQLLGMVHDSKSITGLVINPQHVKQVSDAWVAAGKGIKSHLLFVLESAGSDSCFIDANS